MSIEGAQDLITHLTHLATEHTELFEFFLKVFSVNSVAKAFVCVR